MKRLTDQLKPLTTKGGLMIFSAGVSRIGKIQELTLARPLQKCHDDKRETFSRSLVVHF